MKKNNIILDWLDHYGDSKIDEFVENQLNQNKMKQQRVIVLNGADYATDMQKEIDQAIAEGWFVVSVTAQHVAAESSLNPTRGGYLVVLERLAN